MTGRPSSKASIRPFPAPGVSYRRRRRDLVKGILAEEFMDFCRSHPELTEEQALSAFVEAVKDQHPALHEEMVSEDDAIATLAQRCAQVDILVNNAGGIPSARLGEINEDRWRKAWDLKVFGYINLTREIYRVMQEKRRGVIVNVIGVSGERLRQDYIAGSTGNAALMAFTKTLGGESVDHGVRVVGVNPGQIDTDRLRSNHEATAKKLGISLEESVAQRKGVIPAKRFGDPDEFGAACAFLCSAHAGFITGQNILLDGGLFPGAF